MLNQTDFALQCQPWLWPKARTQNAFQSESVTLTPFNALPSLSGAEHREFRFAACCPAGALIVQALKPRGNLESAHKPPPLSSAAFSSGKVSLREPVSLIAECPSSGGTQPFQRRPCTNSHTRLLPRPFLAPALSCTGGEGFSEDAAAPVDHRSSLALGIPHYLCLHRREGLSHSPSLPSLC